MTAELLELHANATHVDVLIVGAGISGIGAAYHLQDKLPGKSYAILEARDALGGTWDLFRYPGIRSDSDLHTFGYAFKPWTGEKAIADGPSILSYIEETARENGIDRHIRFNHRVVAADWSTERGLWTVEVDRTDTGESFEMTARWLFCASGYYRYDQGHTPEFPGADRFQGPIIHPQSWPEDLDYRGKRVVVIGSGATAVTLLPAMAQEAAHVTMLQRSPTYVLPLPSRDAIANWLRKHLGERRAYAITRRKNIRRQQLVYGFCRRFPNAARKLIRSVNAKQLEGSPVDVDVHFKPTYDPWDQRLCAVPDADLYRALRRGTASVVTDHIETFTERGIKLRSGAELEADVIVTATGFELLAFGGMTLWVDGEEVQLNERVAYKGLMLSGVPNFSFAIGYTNASWTLKVDLVCEYVCRVLAYLDATGQDACVPELPATMERRPLLDFHSNYVKRKLHEFPMAGAEEPWHLSMSYDTDVKTLRRGAIDDGTLRFLRTRRSAAPAVGAVA